MRNPFKKQKPQTFIDEPLEKQLRQEAGLTAIKGTEFTKLRIEHSDEGITELINLKIEQLDKLLKVQNGTGTIQERIERLTREIELWTFYKQFKRASAPWATGGEDRDMSKRLRSTEILFFRNIHKEWTWSMLMMVLQYVSDICYKEWHVAPAPSIFIQALPSSGRIDLSDLARTKKEEIS